MGSRSNSRLLAAWLNWKRPTSENCSEKQIKPPICHLTLFSPLSCLDLKDDWSQGPDSWRKCCKGGVFIYSESWQCLFRMRFLAGSSVPTPGFDHFSKKKKKKNPWLFEASTLTWSSTGNLSVLGGCANCTIGGGPRKEQQALLPQMCWGAVIIIRHLK